MFADGRLHIVFFHLPYIICPRLSIVQSLPSYPKPLVAGCLSQARVFGILGRKCGRAVPVAIHPLLPGFQGAPPHIWIAGSCGDAFARKVKELVAGHYKLRKQVF